MSINQKSGRQTFRRRFVTGSVFVSPCLPECYYKAKRKLSLISDLPSRKHHEETEKTQRTFLDTVAKLGTAIEGMGNPFEEESPDLLIQNAKDIADPIKAESLLEAKQT